MKLTLFFVASFGAITLAQDVPQLDTKQMLLELKDLQAKQVAASTSMQRKNIDLVLRAASSKETAIAFYESAQMATEFQGANRENTQLRDWKKRQEDQLKDGNFRESVRLHLYYLSLGLKCAATEKPEELVPQVAEYLRFLDTADAAKNVAGSLLKVPITDGLFAKWLRLGPELANAKEWEMMPGNADLIAEKFLLPIWRKQKNPALLAYWDVQIGKANQDAGDAKLDFQVKNVGQIRKPNLLWQRAKDLLILEQPNRAAQELFALIKTYPAHPNAEKWIADLENILKPAPATTPASSTTAVTE